jgi:hypothetical protein
MPILATALLLSGAWFAAPTCPVPLSSNRTTVGAITSSTALSVCVSNSKLVQGTNGSMILVVGSSATPSPRCLIYPNGLSPDLTFSLLDSGHIGCWSLYPPGQVVTIVNLSTPSQSTIQAALKSFKPDSPRIKVRPSAVVAVGTSLSFASTAATKLIKSNLLNLPLQVRFKPATYYWKLSPSSKALTSVSPTWKSDRAGTYRMEHRVSYSVEYSFTGLTPWRSVKPNISMTAVPLSLVVKQTQEPPGDLKRIPRLVGGPCVTGEKLWGC